MKETKPVLTGQVLTVTVTSGINPQSQQSEKCLLLRRAWNRLLHRILSVYHVLFSIVFFANLAGLTAILILDRPWDHKLFVFLRVPIFTAVNFFASVLFRNEHIVNMLFRSAFLIPNTAPLWFRVRAARVFQYAGIHSGAAVAGVIWTLVQTVEIMMTAWKGELHSTATLVVATIMAGLLLAMLVTAHPSFRELYHDSFEMTHRYGGWMVIALIWAFGPLTCYELASNLDRAPGNIWISSPAFWFQLVTTLLIIYPWMRIRHQKVKSTVLSSHVVQIEVRGLHGLGGSAIRIAKTPLGQYHSFAVIPHPEKRNHFSILVSRVGDFTSDLINNPRQEIYLRECHAFGVISVARMFKPVLLVATGSGIGPCLGIFTAFPNHPFRILWSTKNPSTTYGRHIINTVLKVDPDATIIDTDVNGRVDIIACAEKKHGEVGSEAIIVISRKKTTNDMLAAMSAKGIPCFGPIFDS